MSKVTKDLPRRCHLELLSPAEWAIRNAMLQIEKLPADVRLTDAVVLLMTAQAKVADYIDSEGVCIGEPCWRNPDTGYMEYCKRHEEEIADLAMGKHE